MWHSYVITVTTHLRFYPMKKCTSRSTRSSTDAALLLRRSSYNKYKAIKTEAGGKVCASGREANRYNELLLLERAGKITNLDTQVRFSLDIEGHHICNYYADFCYDENGKVVVEDSKGVRTRIYQIKKKLMRAIYRIEIFET